MRSGLSGEQMSSEERVNVDRRWWETSVVRGRVLAAGLVLLGAGCAVLGLGARSRQVAANAAPVPAMVDQGTLSLQRVSSPASGEAQVRARSLFAGLPLAFEPNQGQGNLDPADTRAKFVARGSGYSLFLGSEGAILSLASPVHKNQHRAEGFENQQAPAVTRIESIEMKLAGANPNASLAATDPMPGRSNYFIGNDPAKWRTSVPHFARVRYQNAYPGIDLIFYGNQGRLEYDFQVAPGADPAQAELEFNGAKGLELKDGALVIKSELENVRLEAPRVYQEIDGRQIPVDGRFVLRGAKRAGFAIGSYDRSRELIIDPILNFSTYFGGSGDEHSTWIAVDPSLNIYIAGSTTSTNLPVTTGVVQTTLAGTQNIYVAKITPPLGNVVAALDYVTYLGGNGTDTPAGIAVDGRGDAFVAGTTSSTNFPTTATNAYQTTPYAGSTGTAHVFVSELNSGPTPAAASQLLYSSYLSGNGTDLASGMTIDALGYVYITGTTTSDNTANAAAGIHFPASTIPNMEAFQQFSDAGTQFFVTKVNTLGSRATSVSYSTYFGGANYDTSSPVAIGGGIAVDTAGNAYFSGTTNFLYTGCSGCSSTDFPILNAYQPCLDTAPPTAIVNPPTCSNSTNPTAPDAFVAKLNLNTGTRPGQQLLWSTYAGGSENDSSTGIALDTGAANVYLVGTTNSSDFVASTTLTTFAPFQACLNNDPLTTAGVQCGQSPSPTAANDAYVARLSNPTVTTGVPVNVALTYFSYLGGANDEAGLGITVDAASGALLTGWTQSPNTGVAGTFPVFPNPNSIQSTLNGTQDAFLARLNAAAVIGQTTTASWANYFGGTGIDSGTSVALDVNQNTYLAGETNSTDLRVQKPIPVGTTNSGGYDAFVAQFGTALSLSVQGVLTLGTNQTFISAGNQAQFTYTVTNNGPDLATGIIVSDDLSPTITGVPLTFVSASVSSGTCGGITTGSVVSCSLNSLQSGSTVTVTIVVVPTPNASGSQATFNGGTVQVMAQGNIVLAQTLVPATMSDFTMSVNPINQSVPFAGATATYQVQLTPHPLFQANIALSCTGQPTATSCNFTPSNSITLQSISGATATLSIPTTARPILNPTGSLFIRRFYVAWLMIPALMLGIGIGGGRRRRRIAGILTLLSILVLLTLVPACSQAVTQAPVAGTPAGNYTITLTAASGSDSKSQTITLTVP